MIGKTVLMGPHIAPLRDRQLVLSVTGDAAAPYWLSSFAPTRTHPPCVSFQITAPTTTEVPKKRHQKTVRPSRGCSNSCTDGTLIPPQFCADGNTAGAVPVFRHSPAHITPCSSSGVKLDRTATTKKENGGYVREAPRSFMRRKSQHTMKV